MRKSVKTCVPPENGGSEAISGFEYQHHILARKCIEMLFDRNIKEIVCEFYQDGAQIDLNGRYEFIQVKKPKTPWKLRDLIYAKKKEKSILALLFRSIPYKEVAKITFLSNGRPGTSEKYSLAGLMSLLDIEKEERDSEWDLEIEPYEEMIYEYLADQEIDRDTVYKGLRLLNIDLDLPSTGSIEARNREFLESIITRMWGVDMNQEMRRAAYNEIADRVREASKKPRKPRSAKTIRRTEIINIVESAIGNHPFPESREQTTNIHEKLLKKANLTKEQLHYALEMRCRANFTKYELDLDGSTWRDFEDEIAESWNELLKNSQELRGIGLWRSLRKMLGELENQWKQQIPELDPSFAEGVFFCMTATCEVDWRS